MQIKYMKKILMEIRGVTAEEKQQKKHFLAAAQQ